MNKNIKKSIELCNGLNELTKRSDVNRMLRIIHKLEYSINNKEYHCKNTLMIMSVKDVIKKLRYYEKQVGYITACIDVKMNDILNDLEIKNVEF